MVHVYKEVMEAENEYLRLCKKYGENPVYTKYLPDPFGTHAMSLKEREANELADPKDSGGSSTSPKG